MSTTYTPTPSLLTPLAQGPPAGDPAEQARLHLVGGRRQAGGPGVSGQQGGGGPVQLQQGQVVVVGLVVVIRVEVDPPDPGHLLRGAAGGEQQLAQVDGPQRGRVEAVGGRRSRSEDQRHAACFNLHTRNIMDPTHRHKQPEGT